MATPKSEPTVFVGIVLDFETGDLDPQTELVPRSL